jgi:carboxylesterase type B
MFGYPHSAKIAAAGQTQNIGLLDTRAAVEWVVQNIHLFGGDSAEIVFGGWSDRPVQHAS